MPNRAKRESLGPQTPPQGLVQDRDRAVGRLLSRRITVTFTDKEWDWLSRHAAEAGLSLGQALAALVRISGQLAAALSAEEVGRLLGAALGFEGEGGAESR